VLLAVLSTASVGIARPAGSRLRASALRPAGPPAATSALREQPPELCSPYSGPMNPRVRRLIVSGVLGGLILIVVVAAAWNWLR
jgi:hypothetical protein